MRSADVSDGGGLTVIAGKCWVYGDNVDTDVILPSRYLSLTEPAELARHVLEDLDPEFARAVGPGDIVVAGHNFGHGSSREHAPLAFIGAGVGAIVAESFASIFFRNAINVGLAVVECPGIAGRIKTGDVLEVNFRNGVVLDRNSGASFRTQPFPPFLSELIGAGGLVPYTRKRLGMT